LSGIAGLSEKWSSTIIFSVLSYCYFIYFIFSGFLTEHLDSKIFFSLPTAKNCCCGCCSLKTAVLLIGTIEVILYILALHLVLVFNIYLLEMYLYMTLLTVVIIYPMIPIRMLGVSSFLIHGARTEQPGFLIPWIVLQVISFLLSTIYFLFMMLYGQWTSAVISSIFIGVYLYPFFVVWSFKKQLETSNEKCPPSNKV